MFVITCLSVFRKTLLLVSSAAIAGLVLTACGDNTPTPVPAVPTTSSAPAATVPPTATLNPPTATAAPPTATPVPATATPRPPTATPLPPTATPVPMTLETLKISGADEVALSSEVNDLLAKINSNSSTTYPNLKGRVFVTTLDQLTVSQHAQDALKSLGYAPQNKLFANSEGAYVTPYGKPNSPEIATIAVPLTEEFQNALSNSTAIWAKMLAPNARGKKSLLWLYTGGDILKYGYLLTAPKVADLSNSIPGEADFVYPGARRVMPDPDIHKVYYLTSDDYKKVLAFYKTSIPQKGWAFESPAQAMFDAGGISVNRLIKGSQKTTITVVNPKAPDEFKISVDGAGPNDVVIWLILPS